MTLTALKINNHPVLLVEKGAEEYKQEVKKLAATAWQIAYTSLWNTLEFSKAEKENAIKFITAFLEQSSSHRKAYKEFVQRVLLARQYTLSHPGTFIPVPSQWFSTQNLNGFTGTKRWYDSMELSRASLPQYKICLKAFAEAVDETVQYCRPTDFHYWRSYFIQQNAQDLLNLFLSTIANYINNES